MAIAGDAGIKTTPPQCRERMFGLMAVAEHDERGDNDWARGLEYDLDACDDLAAISMPCPTLPEQRKTAHRGYDTEYSDPFAIYAGWECSAQAAVDTDEPWDRADARLKQGWKRTLERAVWEGRDQDGNTFDQSLTGGGATDLTPAGGALDLTAGIAVLESAMADTSSCMPIIHMNAGLGPFLAERALLVHFEGAVHTPSGSAVALGAGYQTSGPGNVAAETGEAWIFASGGVKITSGPRFFTPDRGDLAGAVDRQVNDVRVFAERFFAVGFGCELYAVRVKLNTCCC